MKRLLIPILLIALAATAFATVTTTRKAMVVQVLDAAGTNWTDADVIDFAGVSGITQAQALTQANAEAATAGGRVIQRNWKTDDAGTVGDLTDDTSTIAESTQTAPETGTVTTTMSRAHARRLVKADRAANGGTATAASLELRAALNDTGS